MRSSVITFLFVLLCAACGDKTELAGGKARPGWTQEKVKTLIACEPNGSDECQCTVDKIISEYTPEQVEQKSPYVSKRMLEIQQECSNAGSDIGVEKPIENPVQFGYFFEEPTCTTGHHSCYNLECMCNSLQQSAENNYCALDQRKDKFESAGCPGEFQEL